MAPITSRVDVLHAPELATIGDRGVLAYEIVVSNPGPAPLRLRALRYRAGQFGEQSLQGEQLFERTKLVYEGDAASVPDMLAWRKGQKLAMRDGEIPARRSAAIFVWLSAPRDARLPPVITNDVVVETSEGMSTVKVEAVPRAPAPLVLAPFVRGDRWVFMNGFEDADGHVRTLIPAHDRLWGAQRFAADFTRVGLDGRFFPEGADERDKAASYAYGVDVLAVADATVADVRDGIPENDGQDRAVPITLQSVTGNAVFLDLGQKRFAFYAHLKPGSVLVKKGERVNVGQPIGKLGHSGNSTAPHIHFHVCSAPTGLECNGIPYVFDRFEEATLRVEGSDDAPIFRATSAYRVVERALPGAGTLVKF